MLINIKQQDPTQTYLNLFRNTQMQQYAIKDATKKQTKNQNPPSKGPPYPPLIVNICSMFANIWEYSIGVPL